MSEGTPRAGGHWPGPIDMIPIPMRSRAGSVDSAFSGLYAWDASQRPAANSRDATPQGRGAWPSPGSTPMNTGFLASPTGSSFWPDTMDTDPFSGDETPIERVRSAPDLSLMGARERRESAMLMSPVQESPGQESPFPTPLPKRQPMDEQGPQEAWMPSADLVMPSWVRDLGA